MAAIIMPKMGDAMEAGVIVQFLKKVGDTVVADDAVFEIETDKSNVEVPAGEAGVVHAILAAPGSEVKVGDPVVIIGQGAPPANVAPPPPAAETATGVPSGPGSAKGEAPAPAPLREAGGGGEPQRAGGGPIVVVTDPAKPYGDSFVGGLPEGLGGSASVLSDPIELEVAPPAPDNGGASERVKASPLARAIAAAKGVNLASISAAGTITAADVEAAAKGAPSAPTSGGAIADEVEVQSYNGMRKTIARRLTESKQQIPHFYVTVEVDMEALLSLREQVNAAGGAVKVSVNDCLLKAVSVALLAAPNVNSKFDDNKRLVSKNHHIGFGVALEDGLIVPVVRNVQALSLRQVAAASKPLIEKARAGKLQPADYTGGTFTISNLGAVAEVENFAAIVNPGEAAILAVSSTRTVAAVVNGQLVPRKRMKVTLSADHRVVDGADGAAFLGALKKAIENPLELLL
ncbi:dihydrolipoamide acetyltransferase family protein [Armatimonas rosea]|uniref:Dihydrolipoamide acetyltransferase component of pyruvate dehydrogenase complex n=1 Tax=Armatimonas rosea TaxID=685828 RepID=A0A7W9W756_ARMRO|nr:dihydrolipoamide acetyltransferase family protein [Armatimonas rosea]MBB6050881.1 pyruvate dehydrogenase E2 component (dihydrolipoamide acetyltransferase) [Armatimonas rosea]